MGDASLPWETFAAGTCWRTLEPPSRELNLKHVEKVLGSIILAEARRNAPNSPDGQ